jgi:hypothetical protein
MLHLASDEIQRPTLNQTVHYGRVDDGIAPANLLMGHFVHLWMPQSHKRLCRHIQATGFLLYLLFHFKAHFMFDMMPFGDTKLMQFIRTDK